MHSDLQEWQIYVEIVRQSTKQLTGHEIFNKIKDANTKICWYYIRDCKEETGRVENKMHPLEIKTTTF